MINKKTTVSNWLQLATDKLRNVHINSARLDAELILSYVLKIDKQKLIAYPNRKLSKQQIFHANHFLKRRSKREPLAYIFGEKEFYGRKFIVSKDTLIPRPESENIIELLKKVAQNNYTILDIGTGSGILAITAELELDKNNIENSIFASDISEEALSVAKKNANILKSNINFLHSDLLRSYSTNILDKTDIIIANLPYVNPEWINIDKPNELDYEPTNALFAEDNGLSLIKDLILQAKNLPNLKYIILEADPEQFREIENIAAENGFNRDTILDYIIMLKY